MQTGGEEGEWEDDVVLREHPLVVLSYAND